MKVCLDTNVIIDILGRTEDYPFSFMAFDVSLLRSYEVFIPVTSTVDIFYLLPRLDIASKQKSKQLLAQLFATAEILDARSIDSANAIESNMPDYEDALLAYMAQRNGIDVIITRNLKDFTLSPVPVLSPEEFVRIHKPKDIEYAMVKNVEAPTVTNLGV